MLKQQECMNKDQCFISSDLNGCNLQSSCMLAFSQIQEIRLNSVRNFRTNSNPFTSKQTITLQPNYKISNELRRRNQMQKPSFYQIKNKCIDAEESFMSSPLLNKSANIDETHLQLMSSSIDNQDQINPKILEQQVIINRDNRLNLNLNQLNYFSDSSSGTETSSCVQWEQVMQNRRNLINILQEIVLDSNDNIQPNNQNNNLTKNNTSQQDQDNFSLCKCKHNYDANYNQEIFLQTNKLKEGQQKVEDKSHDSPNLQKQYKNVFELDDNKSELKEVEDEYLDEKESLYFLKKQNRQSFFGSTLSNNPQKNVQIIATKTTMNTINLSTMTTINQTFSPQINKRNSKCMIFQQINLN
ncbi:hypothetical protein ABPG72_012909 [Tetrahymena utriculariae]